MFISKKRALPCPPLWVYLFGLPGRFVCFWCRAREALRQCLPDQLKDTTFAQVLKDDTTTKRWLAQLVKNLQEGQVTDPRGIPLPPQWSSPIPSHYSPQVGEGRGNLQGKQLRFYRRLGIDDLNAELHWRKGARDPRWGVSAAISGRLEDLGSLCYSQETGSWHSSLPPQPRRVSTPANAVFAAGPQWPFSLTSTQPLAGRGDRWQQQRSRHSERLGPSHVAFSYFAFLEDSRCVTSSSLSVSVYFGFLFLILERGVFSGHKL